MFERYTDSARLIINEAREYARSCGHVEIDTGHFLYAMTDHSQMTVGKILSLSSDDVNEFVDDQMHDRATEGHLPFTHDAKKLLELALREALRHGHTWIGAEHMLLAMCSGKMDNKTVAVRILEELDVDLDDVYVETVLEIAPPPGYSVQQADLAEKSQTGVTDEDMTKALLTRIENGPPLSDTDLLVIKRLWGSGPFSRA